MDDHLPKHLCSGCVAQIEAYYTFKIHCEYVDQKLRRYSCVKTMLSEEEGTYDNVQYLDDNNKNYPNVDPLEKVEVEINETAEEQNNFAANQMKLVVETVDPLLQNYMKDKCDQQLDNADSKITKKLIAIDIKFENPISPRKRRSKKGNKKYQCITCHATFIERLKYFQHIKSHGKKRYQCDICNRWFPKVYQCKTHMAIHDKNTYFDCTLCSMRYTNFGNLSRHIRVFHEKKKDHYCDVCGRAFANSTTLKTHKLTHTQNPPDLTNANIPCTACGKSFRNKDKLRSHQRYHHPTNIISCEICNKTCTQKHVYNMHMLTHTGEKPFVCEECGRSFRQVTHLNTHKLTHTGQKKHACSVCSRAFALRGNLTKHMRIHTGEKPYSCKYCPQTFHVSNGLKRHTVVHIRNRDVPMKSATPTNLSKQLDNEGEQTIGTIDYEIDEDNNSGLISFCLDEVDE